MTMHLQSRLSLLRRSPNPLLPQRMCLVLLQLLSTHMCKFQYLYNFTDQVLFFILFYRSPGGCWSYIIIYHLFFIFLFVFTLIWNFTGKMLKPVHFVTVWSEVCTASENSDTSGHPLTGNPSSHQHLHRLSQGTMTCLPLDFLIPPVWQHCLMIQVKLQPVFSY